jgi:hypothetical protein
MCTQYKNYFFTSVRDLFLKIWNVLKRLLDKFIFLNRSIDYEIFVFMMVVVHCVVEVIKYPYWRTARHPFGMKTVLVIVNKDDFCHVSLLWIETLLVIHSGYRKTRNFTAIKCFQKHTIHRGRQWTVTGNYQ